jgi:hypothetical protein
VQWFVSTDQGATFNAIAGATSTTLSFTATLDLTGNQYEAVFTNSGGHATTSAATLTVNNLIPTIVGESVVPVFKKHKPNGKPIGTPVVGFEFQFSTAMNPATVDNPANYQLAWTSTKKVKGKVQTILHPLRVVSATNVGSSSTILVTTNAPTTRFPRGGQVTVLGASPGNVTSAAGVLLGGNPVFRISPKAKGIV